MLAVWTRQLKNLLNFKLGQPKEIEKFFFCGSASYQKLLCSLWKHQLSFFVTLYEVIFLASLKVSKFKNEFMKSWFLPKYKLSIARIFALYVLCQTTGEKSLLFLVHILAETMTSKIHSEIYWSLALCPTSIEEYKSEVVYMCSTLLQLTSGLPYLSQAKK